MKIGKLLAAVVWVAVFALITPAFATVTVQSCSGTLISAAAGYINASGFTADAASACITLSGSTVTVTLENDTANITNVPNMLVGFSFSLSGGATVGGITGVTSGTGVDPTDGVANSATPYLDCDTNPTCVKVATFKDQNTNTTLGSPFTWGAGTGLTTYGSSGFTGTFGGSNPGFFAGNVTSSPDNQTGSGTSFSLHPGAIMNDSAVANGGLANKPHNDTLLSDVQFTFTCTGCTSGTTFSNGLFYWGTDGISSAGQVPEPTSILLMGTMLAVVGGVLRRRISA